MNLNSPAARGGPPTNLLTAHPRAAAIGVLCGLASAVGYTLTNICLRSVTHCDPIWVSCVKAWPTVVLVGPWLIVLVARGERVLPAPRVTFVLILAGLCGQLGGNIIFQASLGIVGIAITAPVTLGAIIVGGAILGRIFLHEPITPRAAVSSLILIAAIAVLSLGAGEVHRSIDAHSGSDAGHSAFLVALGVGGACVSGLAYAVLGVVIRYGVTGRAALSVTLFSTAMVGILSLGALSTWRIGFDGMRQTTQADFALMLLAGVFNAAAFLALTKALQLTTVVVVNSLNATQAAMAAVVGMVFFDEAITQWLLVGTTLTIVGLVLMKGRRRPAAMWEQESKDCGNAIDLAIDGGGASIKENDDAPPLPIPPGEADSSSASKSNDGGVYRFEDVL